MRSARPTVAITAEYKQPDPEIKRQGLKLATSTFRCSTPDVFDLRLNSHSRLNLIQALLQAICGGRARGADARSAWVRVELQLDQLLHRARRHGDDLDRPVLFQRDHARQGHRALRDEGLRCRETDFTLAEAYNADEAFVTGTFGGVTPVCAIDGRPLAVVGGPVTARLSRVYDEKFLGA